MFKNIRIIVRAFVSAMNSLQKAARAASVEMDRFAKVCDRYNKLQKASTEGDDQKDS